MTSFHTIRRVLSLAVVLILSHETSTAEPVEVTLELEASKPGPAIPGDFLGFSYEKNVLALDHFKPSNTAMIRLMRHLGKGNLRFGGNYVEITRYLPGEPKHFSNEGSVIGPRELESMYDFAKASGWSVIHGLNLGANDPAMAATEAAEASRLGGKSLIAFEIGNEPEHYGKKWRPAGYSYQDFSGEISNYLEVMRPKLPRIPLCGPGTTSNFPWFSGFLNDFRSDLVITTRHNYPLAAATTDPANPRFATIGNLLSPATAAEWRKLIGQHQKASEAAGVPFRVTEAGSASSGGKPGVSDVFASALWAADYLFDLAELGVAGVNFHGSFNCRGYTSFCAMKGGGYHVHSNYYGMLFFRQAAQGRVIPLNLTGNGVNLTSHATLGEDGTLRVALINKDLGNSARVGIDPGKRSGQASVMRLTAPSVDAKTGITLGGAGVASDGTWNPKPLETITARDGSFHIDVPAASAALLVIGRGELTPVSEKGNPQN
jgi:hypothetical protein